MSIFLNILYLLLLFVVGFYTGSFAVKAYYTGRFIDLLLAAVFGFFLVFLNALTYA